MCSQRIVPVIELLGFFLCLSVNELEEVLPYVTENAFSWAELLDFRFRHLSGAFFVHQAIYDLLRKKSLPPSRNLAVRKSFDEVWRIISARHNPSKVA